MPESFGLGPDTQRLLTRALDLWERALDLQERYIDFAAQKETRVSASAALRDQTALQRADKPAISKPPRFRANRQNGEPAR